MLYLPFTLAAWPLLTYGYDTVGHKARQFRILGAAMSDKEQMVSRHGRPDPDLYAGDLFGEIVLAGGEAVQANDARLPRLVQYVPGLILCLTVGLAAFWLSEHYGMPTILIGLLMGLALSFAANDPATHSGLDLVSQLGLRLGILLLGLQVTFAQISQVGASAFTALGAIMVLTMFAGLVGARLAGQSRYAGILAGGATAICGASAALALYGVIGKERVDQAQFTLTLVAVALASAIAMTTYPVIAQQLEFGDFAAGFLIGASIHDVGQAIGGGYAYSDAAGLQATIVKLTRVSLLAPVVLAVSFWIGQSSTPSRVSLVRRLALPWFIVGFIVLVALSSLVAVPQTISTGALRLSKTLLLLAVIATAMRSQMNLILELGWRAFLPVIAATLASFLAALFFAAQL